VRRGCFGIAAPEPLADGAASPKQPNANGSFRPTLLLGDFLDFETFKVMSLKNHAVIVFA